MTLNISLIIPVHNGEKYLSGLMESVLSQKNNYPHEFEVVLVENGSDDGSPDICDSYAEKYDFIRALHFGAIGAYRARREGMRAATGDYLVFADADDSVSESLLDEIAGCVSEYNDEGRRADVILYNAAGSESRDVKMFRYPFEEKKLYEDKTSFYEIMCRDDSLNAMWNKAISRTLADKITAEKEEEALFNHGEDLLQTAEILDKAVNIAYLDRILYYYKENNAGLTGSYHKEFLENQKKAWSSFDGYAVKWAGDKFKEVIDERKTLTCCICVSSLIYSDLSGSEVKKELIKVTEDDFYKEYACRRLPDWAPESSVFVHDLMTGDDPVGKMLASSRKFRLKTSVKKILGRQ